MKRIDKALMAHKADILTDSCPAHEDGCGKEQVDEKTKVLDEADLITGCRGITCIECWDKEVD